MKTTKWIYAIVIASLGWAACDNNDDNQDKPTMDATDRTFVEKAALSNMTEIKLAESASVNASDSLVKAFATDMISEHTTAQTELQAIANGYSGINWPEGIDSQHTTIMNQLDSLTGYSFDSLYIHSQVADHQEAVMTFQTETTTGTVDKVKSYATKYLPHIQDHLNRADSIQNMLNPNAEMDTTGTETRVRTF